MRENGITHSSAGCASAESERALLLRQFEADLNFFEVLLLLVNRSCPIRNVDFVLVEDENHGRTTSRALMGTAGALKNPCVDFLTGKGERPEPLFCELVNANGQQEAKTCSIWDRAAAERAGRSGKTQVYECGAGLVDIAVPVLCEGKHVATLYSGQVLRTPPSREKFIQISNNLASLPHLNLTELEKAYWQVPVVGDQDIRDTVRLLEIFADYLAVSWQRLTGIVRDQQRRVRELRYYRKEFADMLLRGNDANAKEIEDLASRIGLTSLPDRALVVKLESEEEYVSLSGSFDFACASALHAIEELCEKCGNVVFASLSKRGICVFQAGTGRLSAFSLAEEMLKAAASRCDMRVRVGIGDSKGNCSGLIDSYHEALVALAESTEAISVFRKPAAMVEELTLAAEEIGKHVRARRLYDARVLCASLPRLANLKIGSAGRHLAAQRRFLHAVLDDICVAILEVGGPVEEITNLHQSRGARLRQSGDLLELQQAFLETADYLLLEVRRLHLGRHEKIVDRARGLIRHSLEDSNAKPPLTPASIAARLGISARHLSRLFKLETGHTFERYVMIQRVELAKRLLLDPSNSVSSVAERCGFCTSSYFSQVFHSLAGCSPRDYYRQPDQHARPA